jgi:hypothetical protein
VVGSAATASVGAISAVGATSAGACVTGAGAQAASSMASSESTATKREVRISISASYWMFERFSLTIDSFLISQRFSLLQRLLSLKKLQVNRAIKSISTRNFTIVPDNVPVIVNKCSNILAKKEGGVKSVVKRECLN